MKGRRDDGDWESVGKRSERFKNSKCDPETGMPSGRLYFITYLTIGIINPELIQLRRKAGEPGIWNPENIVHDSGTK